MSLLLQKRIKYNKTYYDKKRDKILSHLKEKIKCPICNVYIQRVNKIRHQKSKKHHKNIDKLLGEIKQNKFGGKYQESIY